ncbi:hypothetical protein GOP47_0008205 [Adiantum capillus-veneris]|uniref:Neprosin PEP catalytic domain-containing protein n=1 Tax=Adiantum capillus-veneris TaxID=13818 RepID=A0A9D4UXT7_ADICA|nr:hypothetical protein GOP47_0008205 [Adiantum capillus-veneris]
MNFPTSAARFYKSERLARTRTHLHRLNKPAFASIKSPDGDTIDCVLISQQPALDHPKLKDHKIQMEPPSLPEGIWRKQEESEVSEVVSSPFKPQLWHQVEKCPSGTIPIRRTTEADLLRATKFANYGKKQHRPVQPPPKAPQIRNALNENGHQHAIAYVEGDNYYGAKAVINVWNPLIQVPNEFSLSQLWVLAGSFDGDLNSIEAGWQVSPDLYGDNNTRLFIYWTSDAYQGTGCYNLLCSGFVQINDQIALGASISPVSTYNDKQFDIEILIWKDPRGGDWWMSFGRNSVLGYWPSSLFSYLSDSATMVEWGGEVVNSEPGGRHTDTQMGSGHFASEGFGKASYFSNLQIVDATNNLRTPNMIDTFSENSGCYDVQDGFNTEWGYHFYYGGPGWGDDCQ